MSQRNLGKCETLTPTVEQPNWWGKLEHPEETGHSLGALTPLGTELTTFFMWASCILHWLARLFQQNLFDLWSTTTKKDILKINLSGRLNCWIISQVSTQMQAKRSSYGSFPVFAVVNVFSSHWFLCSVPSGTFHDIWMLVEQHHYWHLQYLQWFKVQPRTPRRHHGWATACQLTTNSRVYLKTFNPAVIRGKEPSGGTLMISAVLVPSGGTLMVFMKAPFPTLCHQQMVMS